MYADYNFYVMTYGGAAIPAASYDAISEKAMYHLDTWIPHQGTPSEAVKMASCAMAEALFSQSQSAGVSSETVGKHSITYASKEERKAMLFDAIYPYLKNTGLLYRGVPVLW